MSVIGLNEEFRLKKMKRTQILAFIKWYEGHFLASREYGSPILVSENKGQTVKFIRIGRVATKILENPKLPLQDLRKEIAIGFFVNMRTALDYINYAKLIIEKWNKTKRRNKRCMSPKSSS